MKRPVSTLGSQAPARGQSGGAGLEQRRAQRRLRWLLVPIFLRILWLHFILGQGSQFARLRRSQGNPDQRLPQAWAEWAARVVARFVARVPIVRRRPCYWRSQVIFDLLPRFGFPVTLHVGAIAEPDQTAAHLWVSTRGVVLVEAPAECARYLELAVYHSAATYD